MLQILSPPELQYGGSHKRIKLNRCIFHRNSIQITERHIRCIYAQFASTGKIPQPHIIGMSKTISLEILQSYLQSILVGSLRFSGVSIMNIQIKAMLRYTTH